MTENIGVLVYFICGAHAGKHGLLFSGSYTAVKHSELWNVDDEYISMYKKIYKVFFRIELLNEFGEKTKIYSRDSYVKKGTTYIVPFDLGFQTLTRMKGTKFFLLEQEEYT